ncbi:MAG: hypothetical protein IKB02_05190 [Clostridia bacterium]|nr:hypothetical protein [Clostridia bacterium]
MKNNLMPRYCEISPEGIKFSDKKAEIESAIELLRMLHSYHQRFSFATDPNFMAAIFERDLVTAINCLERERDLIIEQKEAKDIIGNLKSLRNDLSHKDNEAIKVIARRWSSVNKDVGEKKKVELLFSAYDEALEKAISLLETFL